MSLTLVVQVALTQPTDRPLSHIIQSCDPLTNFLVPLRATSDSHSQLETASELDYTRYGSLPAPEVLVLLQPGQMSINQSAA